MSVYKKEGREGTMWTAHRGSLSKGGAQYLPAWPPLNEGQIYEHNDKNAMKRKFAGNECSKLYTSLPTTYSNSSIAEVSIKSAWGGRGRKVFPFTCPLKTMTSPFKPPVCFNTSLDTTCGHNLWFRVFPTIGTTTWVFTRMPISMPQTITIARWQYCVYMPQ